MPDYILTKLASMIGGLFGGAAILTFIRPQTVTEAFIRGAVSTGSAVIFSAPMIDWFQLSNNWENQLMIGFVIGFIAYSVLGMVANFLIKHKNGTIIDAANDIRGKKESTHANNDTSNSLRNGRRATDFVITSKQDNDKGN